MTPLKENNEFSRRNIESGVVMTGTDNGMRNVREVIYHLCFEGMSGEELSHLLMKRGEYIWNIPMVKPETTGLDWMHMLKPKAFAYLFCGLNLKGKDLSEIRFDKTVLDREYWYDFTGCKLNGSIFDNVSLRGVRFNGASMYRVQFVNCSLLTPRFDGMLGDIMFINTRVR